MCAMRVLFPLFFLPFMERAVYFVHSDLRNALNPGLGVGCVLLDGAGALKRAGVGPGFSARALIASSTPTINFTMTCTPASNLIYSNKLTIKSVIIRKVDTLLSTGSTLLIVDIRILVEHYWAAVTI